MVISINDHPDIRRVFYGFKHQELGISYTVGGGAGSQAKELLIWNQNCDDRRRETGTLRLF
jgi:DNA adenine methylase